jgi:TatD DNase family protein
MYPERVFAAYGFHPEQEMIGEAEVERLLSWIRNHHAEMVAVGEVGLPYYNRKQAEERGEHFELEPYVKLLDRFIGLAAELGKPIVLHAVYEDADIACDLLDKHRFRQAHFHWFKGSDATVRRMIEAGYFISVTPDVVYEPEIRRLVALYPLELMMVETDGPWPYEGPFAGETTNPGMIRESIRQIAVIKGLSESEVYDTLYRNTKRFYGLVGRSAQ